MGLLSKVKNALADAVQSASNFVSSSTSNSSSSSGSGGGSPSSSSSSSGSSTKISGAASKKTSTSNPLVQSSSSTPNRDSSAYADANATPVHNAAPVQSAVDNANANVAKAQAALDTAKSGYNTAYDDLSRSIVDQEVANAQAKLDQAVATQQKFNPLVESLDDWTPTTGYDDDSVYEAAKNAADIANERGKALTNNLKTYKTEESNWQESKYLPTESIEEPTTHYLTDEDYISLGIDPDTGKGQMDRNDAWSPNWTNENGKTWQQEEWGDTTWSDVVNGIKSGAKKAKDAYNALYTSLRADAYDNMDDAATMSAAKYVDYLWNLNFDIFMDYVDNPSELQKGYTDALNQFLEAGDAIGDGVREQLAANVYKAQKEVARIMANPNLSDKEKQALIDTVKHTYNTGTMPTVTATQQQANEMRDEVSQNAPWFDNNAEISPEIQQVKQGLEQIAETTTNKKLADTIKKYTRNGKTTDDFLGQFAASYGSGDISELSHQAWSAYLTAYDNDPNDPKLSEYKDVVEAYNLLQYYYNSLNAESLDDEGRQASLLSKDFAQYLPQFKEQSKARLPAVIAGAAIGEAITPIPGIDGLIGAIAGFFGKAGGLVAGAKAGNIIGSIPYSYDTMRGASAQGLVELLEENGVDTDTALETAAKMSRDEAILATFIESADTAFDTLSLIPGIGDALGKLTVKALSKGIGAYVANIASEYGEEFTQELITVANERRLSSEENGIDSGVRGLDREIRKVIAEVYNGVKNGDGDAKAVLDRLRGAGRRGAGVAITMGVAGGVANNAITNPLYQEAIDTINSAEKNPITQQINQAVIDGEISEDAAKAWNTIAKGKTEDQFAAGIDAFNEYATDNFVGAKEGDVVLDNGNNVIGTVTKANDKGITVKITGEDGKTTTETVKKVGNNGYLDPESQLASVLENGGVIADAEEAKTYTKRAPTPAKPKSNESTDAATGTPITAQPAQAKPAVGEQRTSGEERAEDQAPSAPMQPMGNQDLSQYSIEELEEGYEKVYNYLLNLMGTGKSQSAIDAATTRLAQIEAEINNKKSQQAQIQAGEDMQDRGEQTQPNAQPKNPLAQEERSTSGEARAEQQEPEAPKSKAQQFFDENPQKGRVYTSDYKGATVKIKNNGDGTYTVSMASPLKNGTGFSKAAKTIGTVSSIDEANQLVVDEYNRRNPGHKAFSDTIGTTPQNASGSPESASAENGTSIPEQQTQSQEQEPTFNTGSNENVEVKSYQNDDGSLKTDAEEVAEAVKDLSEDELAEALVTYGEHKNDAAYSAALDAINKEINNRSKGTASSSSETESETEVKTPEKTQPATQATPVRPDSTNTTGIPISGTPQAESESSDIGDVGGTDTSGTPGVGGGNPSGGTPNNPQNNPSGGTPSNPSGSPSGGSPNNTGNNPSDNTTKNKQKPKATTAKSKYGSGKAYDRITATHEKFKRNQSRSSHSIEELYYKIFGKTYESEQNFKRLHNLNQNVENVLNGKMSFSSLKDYANKVKSAQGIGQIINDDILAEIVAVAALEEQAKGQSEDSQAVADFQSAAANTMAHIVARMEMVEKTERAKAKLDKLAQESGKRGNKAALKQAMDAYNRLQITGDNFWRMTGNWDADSRNQGYAFAREHQKTIATRISEEAKLKDKFSGIDKKSKEFRDFASGTTKSNVDFNGHKISLMEGIKFVMACDTLRAFAKSNNMSEWQRLSELNGFCFEGKDGKPVFVDAVGGNDSERQQWIQERYDALKAEIANNKAASEYMNAAIEMYYEASKDAGKVYNKVNGYDRYMYDKGKYTDIHYANKQSGNIDFRYEDADATDVHDTASMQERLKKSGGYIMVPAMSRSVDAYISQISDYIAFEEFGQKLGILSDSKATGGSYANTLRNVFGDQYAKYFDNYVKSMTLYKEGKKGKLDSALSAARRAMMSGALVGSVSVPLKQVSSFFDIAGVVDPRAVARAFATNPAGKKVKGIKNNLFLAREQSISDPDYAEMFNDSFLMRKIKDTRAGKILMGATNFMDVKAVSNVYRACIFDVEYNQLTKEQLYKNGKNMKDGLTEEGEFYVNSLFEKAVLETQPVFTPQARNELARTDNQLLRMFQTFRTQQTQNYNRMLQAWNENEAAMRNGKDTKETSKKLRQTIGGQLTASASLAVLTAFANSVLHKRKKYKDEDDEYTREQILGRIGLDAFKSMMGNALWAGDLTSWLIDKYNSKMDKYWDWKFSNKESQYVDIGDHHIPIISSGAIGTALQVVNSLAALSTDAAVNGWTPSNIVSARYIAGNIATEFGVPVNNVYNAINAFYQWTVDGLNFFGITDIDRKYDDIFTQFVKVDNSAQNKLYKAIKADDYNKLSKMIDSLGEDKFQNQVYWSALDKYTNGKIDEQEFYDMLVNFGGKSGTEANNTVQSTKQMVDSGVSKYNGENGKEGRKNLYDKHKDIFPDYKTYNQILKDITNHQYDDEFNGDYYTTWNGKKTPAGKEASATIDILNEALKNNTLSYDAAKIIWTEYYGRKANKGLWSFVGK